MTVSLSETARERETFRYGSCLIQDTIPNPTDGPLPASALRSSSDSALTAFAQLAVLRLRASRALVSLFDSNLQYVVAEATPGLSLEPAVCAGQCPLWLSGTAIPRTFGTCEHVLTATPQRGQDGRDGLLPLSVVCDLAADRRFADRPFIKHDWPRCRFYAGVPIRTRHGVNIGVLSVFDQEPRAAFSPDDGRFMRELSSTIMQHLEGRRVGKSHSRTERMVRGIGDFVDGSTTLTRNRLDHAHARENAQPAAPSPPESVNAPASRATKPSVRPPTPDSSDDSSDARPDDHVATEMRGIFTKAANAMRDSVQVDGVIFLDATITTFGGKTTDASNASSSSSASSDDTAAQIPSAGNHDGTPEPYAPVLGFSGPSLPTVQGDPASNAPPKLPESFLRKLLRRYPKGNIFNFNDSGAVQSSDLSSEEASADHAASAHHRTDPLRAKLVGRQTRMKQGEQAMLMQLLPEARCNAFAPVWDPQAMRWSAAAFAYTKANTRVFSSKGELSYLVAFGAVVMSEVSRLKSMLADKSKMDMLSSLSHELRSPLHGVVLGVEMLHDSALDGFQRDVLNTVETCGRTLLDTVDHLLHWTKINNFMVKPEPRHGRSPLHDGERGLRAERMASKTIEAGMMSIASVVAVDALAEEVVESVFAGHTYQRLIVAHVANALPGQGDRASLRRLDRIHVAMDSPEADLQPLRSASASGDVVVSLDVEPDSDWRFYTQAGALRRIIMNLLGNSLKYTTKGFIGVSLRQRPSPSNSGRTRARRDRKVIVITVSDSGIGIGEDYLRNHLFAPFSQENRLSPGVGLGLSLVKKIVSTLGGRIKVQSSVNVGTTITVDLPLEVPSASPRAASLPVDRGEAFPDSFEKHVRLLRGLRIRLVGFSQDRPVVRQGAGTASFGNHISSEKAALSAICQGWLHMKVLDDVEDAAVTPDLVICSDTHLQLVSRKGTDTPAPGPIVVICHNVAVARGMESKHRDSNGLHPSTSVEFSAQPIGPRKLARVLTFSLERRRGMANPSVPADLTPPEGLNVDLLSSTQLQSSDDGPGAAQRPAGLTSANSIAYPINRGALDGSLPDWFLLVDDNPINLRILSSCMKKLGQSHDVASDGKEAVDAFRKKTGAYKCIFMDISMPVMNGFEATCLIRQHEKETQLPACAIFALTGLASASAQKEAFACGIDLFLTKPVKLKELSQILSSKGLI
ncbi:hypothetical protein RJ55_03830 [Drechmeria coniospora]|nr:hypothetical protein RJ55_03830 [Drechmeria coniospora]